MAEIFRKMVHNLPLVIDTLQEPKIPSNEPITAPDNVVPTVSTTDPDLEAGTDNVALQFASNHLTPLAVLFGEFGVHGWVALCNRLILKYTACIGTELLRAFCQRRPEDIIEFIQSEYKEMVHEGRVDLEDEEIQIHGSSVWTRINVPGFLCILIQMVLEDIPRVVYATWLEVAKNIAKVIFQQYSANERTDRACKLCAHGTYHGIYSYNFFHDFGASKDMTAVLFTGTVARQSMALALRSTNPSVGGSLNTLFRIFDCICSNDGNLHFRLLELSPPHTMNLVSSMVILVMEIQYVRNRHFPTLSEHRQAELKAIHESNKSTFRDIIACSQVNVPMALQKLFCLNLLNILAPSPMS
ncbi:hypothetical protein PISMIDRAFT_10719 [Pisolithus microcarpus 441]|uniref:Uncharacterized protein n=1 Tax=Pisolithus microcarpus 441 TaxID=765257 RepID=A0A0C9YFT8_9AGAM|nr:hypothetical protein BKA83DRAFT_10719 [Pisolithus microcarpus]KIK23760.1 hypothetical protein PISMIDRAFT_10719 [Pisolithus microcarpus 441]